MDAWVPINKRSEALLPNDRAFTAIEALFSLQLDHNAGNPVTVAGMAAIWGWSRKRVMLFLDRIGVRISYPESTAIRRNQRGHIWGHKRDISPQKKGHNLFIDFNDLQATRDIPEEKKGHKRDIKGATTNRELRTKKEKTCAFPENALGGNGKFYLTAKGKKLSGWKLKTFSDFWDAFNLKTGKAPASDSWLNIPGLDDILCQKILVAAKSEAARRPDLIEKGKTPKMAQGWITQRRWEDELDTGQRDPDENVKWLD